MGRRAFIPRHHPKAGIRKARQDARYAGFDRDQAVLRGEYHEGETVVVDNERGQLVFRHRAGKELQPDAGRSTTAAEA